jgi:hypothetical protein
MRPEQGSPFFTVTAVVGSYGKTQLLVDTGASETVLADWFVKEQNIPLLADTVNGTDSGGAGFEAAKTTAAAIALSSGFTGASGPLVVVPTPPVFKQLGIGGIFSPQSFFGGKAVFLDFPGKTVFAGAAAEAAVKGRTPVEVVTLSPCSQEMPDKYLLAAFLNGVPVRLYIDTGGRSAAITREFSVKLGLKGGVTKDRAGAASRRKVVRLNGVGLKIGVISSAIPVDVEPRGVSCPEAQGKLGNDFFLQYGLLLNAERDNLSLFRDR